MKRNMFGDPQPANAEEINRALDEFDEDPAACHATIEHTPDEHEPFNGWCAEIWTSEDTISTCAFESREALVSALQVAGISDIDDA